MREKFPAKPQSCKGVHTRSWRCFLPLRLCGNLLLVSLCVFVVTIIIIHPSSRAMVTPNPSPPHSNFSRQAQAQEAKGKQTPKLEGCISCHGQIEPMHKYGSAETLTQLKDGKDAVGLTCTSRHGGNPLPRKSNDDPKEIERVKREAHVQARFPEQWRRDGKSTGANPERTNTLLARESWEYVRFINPGDIRVAERTCGSSDCHAIEQKGVARSMMTHGAML